MKRKQFDISIDHEMLAGAKRAFDTCMQIAIRKAISTGMNEGSATLKINFEIFDAMEETGEINKSPDFKYRASYTVPMKESMDATIVEKSRLIPGEDGWQLVNEQISMNELMAEEKQE